MKRKINLIVTLLSICVSLNAQHNDCKETYFDTPKKVAKLKPMFDFMNLKSGQTVASIGAGGGWFEAAASIYFDSLTFYLEDITDDCLNPTTVKSTVAQYAKIKQKPITNPFELVVGTDSSTKLPPRYFDRVLLNNTYHHFTKKEKMLSDVRNLLKNEGFLYVFEPIIFESQAKRFKCAYYTSEQTLIQEFEKAGFTYLTKYDFADGSPFFKFKLTAPTTPQ
jgi:ubiquinone/menaquinone biosynthesis C-methylase UbiE